MPQEFSETSNQSIWALAKYIAAIADVLKKELPFDTLTASCHVEDGTDDFTIGILARWADCYHSIMIYTHYLDAPPERSRKKCIQTAAAPSVRFTFFPLKRRCERLWKCAEFRGAGRSIKTANGCRFQVRTWLF